MSKYLLSFCIPVYNHAALTYKIVTTILKNKSEQIQVVVFDDASPDDTVERLSSIQDERLKIITADHNVGPQRNWYRTLMQGDGKWLYFLVGRDAVNPHKIDSLLQILERLEQKNVGFVRESFSIKNDVQLYSSKEAIKHLLDFAHPTGSIFLRTAFHAKPDKKSYFEIADVYPENYVKRDILKEWRCAEIRGVVFGGKSIVPLKHVRSLYEKKPLYPFYHPKRTTGQFLEITDMIEQTGGFSFSAKELDELFIYKWKFLLYTITFYQRIRFLSPGFLGHYGEKKRKVSRKEMIQNMMTAYQDVTAHDKGMSIIRKRKMIEAMLRQSVRILFWTDSKIESSEWNPDKP